MDRQPHTSHPSRRTFDAAFLFLALAGATVSTAFLPPAAVAEPKAAGVTGAAAAAPAMPESLTNAGEFAENLYDAARDGDWAAAGKKVAALKAATAQLTVDLGRDTAGQRKMLEQFESQLAAADKAVVAKQKQDVTRTANQMTLTAAELSAPFRPKIPVDVTRLDYLGRELEIWAAVADLDKLKATADQIGATWTKLRADVVAHGGAREATTFGALVVKVAAARSVAEYAAVTQPILDEVDNLEHVYK